MLVLWWVLFLALLAAILVGPALARRLRRERRGAVVSVNAIDAGLAGGRAGTIHGLFADGEPTTRYELVVNGEARALPCVIRPGDHVAVRRRRSEAS